MSTLEVIVIIVVVVMVLLIVGGLVITGRRSRAEEGELHDVLREADHALALARAEDRGWDRHLLEAACREAFAARSPVEPRELQLVQVVDRPGTDEDEALFRVITDAGSEEIRLTREGDAWVPAGPAL